MLKDNLEKIFSELDKGNNLGEKITLVAATKYVDIDMINQAIELGLKDVGENKAQEFRDKYELYKPVNKHFIGRIQSNKLKYIIGKTHLIQSIDNLKIAEEANKKSAAIGIVTDILAEVNIGNELSKGGITLSEAYAFTEELKNFSNLRLRGLMAMLPASEDTSELALLTGKMRDSYEKLKATTPDIDFLSVGMSGDYKIAIENGSNMVRIGSAIFGKRY